MCTHSLDSRMVAVLRIHALPTPLHLSEIFTGCAAENPKTYECCHYSVALRDFRKETLFQTAIRSSTLASFPGLLTTRGRLVEYLDWLGSSQLLRVSVDDLEPEGDGADSDEERGI